MIPPLNQIFVDAGASSAEEVKALGIRIGGPAVIASEYFELNCPDLVVSKSIDNRVGCAGLLRTPQAKTSRLT